MKVSVCAALAMLVFSTSSFAYEIGTHALVTRVALEGSVLSSSHPQSILPVLGIDRLGSAVPLQCANGGS